MKDKIEFAFALEIYRQRLAKMHNLDKIKVFYSNNLPEIKDKNTPVFWDKLFKNQLTLSDQDGMTQDRVKMAAKYCPPGKVKILDIGAGLGFLEEILSKNPNIELHGNDFSDVSVNRLRKMFNGEYKKESIYKMKYPNESFDAVFALEVLEHIPPSKILTIMKYIRKMLKRNGVFIVSVPINEGLEEMYPNNPNSHLRMYSEDLLKTELEISGFKVINSSKFFAFSDKYFLKKTLSKVLKRWRPNSLVLKAIKN